MSGFDYAGTDAEVRAWAIEAMTELGAMGAETMMHTARRVKARQAVLEWEKAELEGFNKRLMLEVMRLRMIEASARLLDAAYRNKDEPIMQRDLFLNLSAALGTKEPG
jgi:hypothetical protein